MEDSSDESEEQAPDERDAQALPAPAEPAPAADDESLTTEER